MGKIDISHAAGGGFYNAYVKASDTKPYNTNGGSSIADAWTTRDINTEDSDDAGICSIAADQITLEAGTYTCSIRSPFYNNVAHAFIRLYNITGAAVLLTGSMTFVYIFDHNDAWVVGEFTLSEQSALEVQYIVNTAVAANGLGLSQVLIASSPSIFTTAEFWRKA